MGRAALRYFFGRSPLSPSSLFSMIVIDMANWLEGTIDPKEVSNSRLYDGQRNRLPSIRSVLSLFGNSAKIARMALFLFITCGENKMCPALFLFVACKTKCQKSVCTFLCNFSSLQSSSVESAPNLILLVGSQKEMPCLIYSTKYIVHSIQNIVYT